MSSSTKLLATIAKIDNNNFTLEMDNMITIDTCNNRIGINTLDPSYSIDVLGNRDVSGVLRCDTIICNDISINNQNASFSLIDLFMATKQLYQDLSGQFQLVDNSMLPVYDIFR